MKHRTIIKSSENGTSYLELFVVLSLSIVSFGKRVDPRPQSDPLNGVRYVTLAKTLRIALPIRPS